MHNIKLGQRKYKLLKFVKDTSYVVKLLFFKQIDLTCFFMQFDKTNNIIVVPLMNMFLDQQKHIIKQIIKQRKPDRYVYCTVLLNENRLSLLDNSHKIFLLFGKDKWNNLINFTAVADDYYISNEQIILDSNQNFF